jgi:trehalose 6-phosphate phosphatase
LQQLDVKAILSEFMERLITAPASVLLLDYDGTLAPFQVERLRAYPYPGVVEILENILKSGKTRVVIVSGRPIDELRSLLLPLRSIEIWGSHGLEHQLVNGTCHQVNIAPEIAAALQQAESWLVATGLDHRTEVKPGGVAIHWRGVPEARIDSIRTHARKAFDPFADQSGLKLLEFEGGLELRVAHPNKGDAVRSILDSSDAKAPVAYLGDDYTDEDAFRVLNAHGLTALVRPEYRETSAQIWLEPPRELLGFLEQWLNNISK